MTELDEGELDFEVQSQQTLPQHLDRIPKLVNIKDIHEMIDIQVATLDRLDCTNKSLANCSAMAQSKLAATTKLYKRTAKQIADSKKDLDVIYRKILDMKAKIKAERPEIFETDNEQKDDTTTEQTSEANSVQHDQ